VTRDPTNFAGCQPLSFPCGTCDANAMHIKCGICAGQSTRCSHVYVGKPLSMGGQQGGSMDK
jgi:hypothetical protein